MKNRKDKARGLTLVNEKVTTSRAASTNNTHTVTLNVGDYIRLHSYDLDYNENPNLILGYENEIGYAVFGDVDMEALLNANNIPALGITSCNLYLPKLSGTFDGTYRICNANGTNLQNWMGSSSSGITIPLKTFYDSCGSWNFSIIPVAYQDAVELSDFGTITITYNNTYSRDIYNIPYGSHALQVMDIHIPSGLNANDRVPAVITLHGGIWSTGASKTQYDYITPFITNECGCIHVNMNYRLLNGGGIDLSDNAEAPYRQMLDDIKNAIEYLKNNNYIYHIDTSKIALMGYSSGGHLALLYAYKSKYAVTNDGIDSPIPVSLVIAEAAPTYFTEEMLNRLTHFQKNAIQNLAGGEGLTAISPSEYADTSLNLPFTIFVRGEADTLVTEDHIDKIWDNLKLSKKKYFLIEDKEEPTMYNHESLEAGSKINPEDAKEKPKDSDFYNYYYGENGIVDSINNYLKSTLQQ